MKLCHVAFRGDAGWNNCIVIAANTMHRGMTCISCTNWLCCLHHVLLHTPHDVHTLVHAWYPLYAPWLRGCPPPMLRARSVWARPVPVSSRSPLFGQVFTRIFSDAATQSLRPAVRRWLIMWNGSTCGKAVVTAAPVQSACCPQVSEPIVMCTCVK